MSTLEQVNWIVGDLLWMSKHGANAVYQMVNATA